MNKFMYSLFSILVLLFSFSLSIYTVSSSLYGLSVNNSINALMEVSPLENLFLQENSDQPKPVIKEPTPHNPDQNREISQAFASAYTLNNSSKSDPSTATASASSSKDSSTASATTTRKSEEPKSQPELPLKVEESQPEPPVKMPTEFPQSCDTFLEAVQDDMDYLVEELLKKDIKFLKCTTSNGEFPIHLAAKFASSKALLVLISFGADINILDPDNNKALDIALKNRVDYDYARITEILINAGSQAPYDNQYSYLIPIFAFDDNLMQRFDFSNQTALHLAAERNHFGFVQLFIEKEIPINIINDNGQTPLHAAVRNNALLSMKVLLAHGCDLNPFDYSGFTPIHTAFELDNPHEIITMLLEYGADVNASNIYGNTPIILAAIWNLDTDIVSEFINYPVDLNSQNSFGDYALLEAVRRENKDLIQFLLKNEANPYIKNYDGESALSVATEMGEFMRSLFMEYL